MQTIQCDRCAGNGTVTLLTMQEARLETQKLLPQYVHEHVFVKRQDGSRLCWCGSERPGQYKRR